MLKGQTNDSDHELLRAWRGGDNGAGSRLFKRHALAMSRFFRNKLTCADDSADLLHETFIALQRSNKRATDSSEPRAVISYLYATANNVLCAYLRKKYKRQSELLDFTTVCVKNLEPASVSSIMLRRRDLQVFVEALRAIPLDDQVLLEFKYFDGLSIIELSELLEVSETTIPGRLQRAKARLRHKVEEITLQTKDIEVPEPSDDALDAWAREVREQMGWDIVSTQGS